MATQNSKCDNSEFGQPIKFEVMDEGFKQPDFLIEYFDGIQKGDLYEEPFQDWYPGQQI